MNAPANKKPKKPPDRIICVLPASTINRTLEMDLETADVILTRAAHVHAQRRHPNEFPVCLPHLAAVISEPLYIGDDFDNNGIELIRRIPALGGFMLVAVNIQANASGQYEIASFYIVSEKKILSRREKGFLRVAIAVEPETAAALSAVS